MLCALEELILQSEAHLIRFHGADHISKLIRPGLHIEFPQLAIASASVARIVLGKSSVPSDARHQSRRQVQALQIGAGFRARAVQLHQLRADDLAMRRLALAGVVIGGLLQSRPSGRTQIRLKYIYDKVARRRKLRLSKERKQIIIPAVSVGDNDLLAAVAGHLVGGLLQQIELQPWAISNRARLVPGFEDLTKIILRVDNRILLLGAVN